MFVLAKSRPAWAGIQKRLVWAFRDTRWTWLEAPGCPWTRGQHSRGRNKHRPQRSPEEEEPCGGSPEVRPRPGSDVRPEPLDRKERTLQGRRLGTAFGLMFLKASVPVVSHHRVVKCGGSPESFPSPDPLHGALPRHPSPASLGPLRFCFRLQAAGWGKGIFPTEKCANVRGAPPNPVIPARVGGTGVLHRQPL